MCPLQRPPILQPGGHGACGEFCYSLTSRCPQSPWCCLVTRYFTLFLALHLHGPYRKLWNEFSSSPYDPSAKHAGRKKRGKKRWFMVRTKQTRLIRCLLYGYKRAKGLVGNICSPHRKLWTGKLSNQSSRTFSHIPIITAARFKYRS